MDQQNLIVKQEGKVLSIILNRPDVLNAFTEDMKKDLIKVLESAKLDTSVQIIMLSGKGRSFCAGGDIKRMGNTNPVSTYDYLSISKDLILLMNNLEKPIVAAVHGDAAGGGASLALASDIILAAEGSKFSFSFSKIGLVPDNGGVFFLVRAIGLYRTKEILFKGKSIDADTAFKWGMINHIYPSSDFYNKALSYSEDLAEGPIRALGQIKKITNHSLVNELEDVLEREQLAQSIMQTTEEHEEGVRAFKEKRTPNFHSK